eukprot:1143313-Pelagomonas_calceolata.AAC.1
MKRLQLKSMAAHLHACICLRPFAMEPIDAFGCCVTLGCWEATKTGYVTLFAADYLADACSY